MQEPGHLSSRKYFTRTEDQGSGSSPGHSSTYSMPPPPPQGKEALCRTARQTPRDRAATPTAEGQVAPQSQDSQPKFPTSTPPPPGERPQPPFYPPRGRGGGERGGAGLTRGRGGDQPRPAVTCPAALAGPGRHFTRAPGRVGALL